MGRHAVIKVGDQFTRKDGEKLTVIAYENCRNVLVEKESGEQFYTTSQLLRNKKAAGKYRTSEPAVCQPLPDNMKWHPKTVGEYAVSDDGRVYSFKRGKITALNPGIISYRMNDSGNGYFAHCLGHPINGTVLVHRFVAETYLPHKDGCTVVDHIDGNKHNNHPSNLRWTTPEGNVKAYYATTTKAERIRRKSRDGKYDDKIGEACQMGWRNGLPLEVVENLCDETLAKFFITREQLAEMPDKNVEMEHRKKVDFISTNERQTDAEMLEIVQMFIKNTG